MANHINNFPNLGFGLGLRPQHYAHIFEHAPAVDWFEIISENFMDTDGRPKRNLERILEQYPVVMHGVALSIGTVDALQSEYLKKLKTLSDWVKPAWISDHLCWTGVAHRNTHDLLPIPYTEEALRHIIKRIQHVQDYLGQPIALENPSTYLEFTTSTIPEAEFIAHMAKESGCYLLLDINNIYVSCYNHGLDAKSYIDAIPLDHVIQIHLAGHDNKGTHIIDTHDHHVTDEVWALYQYVVQKAKRIPNTMIEWDDRLPEFDVLYAELQKARGVASEDNVSRTFPMLHQTYSRPIHITSKPVGEQQNRMQNAILSGFDQTPSAWIAEKPWLSAQAQLDIYIQAYRYRLYDAIADDYPVLSYYLGSAAFEALLWGFISDHHSEHFNIARYATKLPDYVRLIYSSDVCAQEICELETTLAQLADAEESPPLAPQALSGLSLEALLTAQILPRKALKLISFTYPVNEYYRQVMADEQPSLPIRQASWVAVFRHNDVMWRADMAEDEFYLLSRLDQGVPLQTALADMNEAAGTMLAMWFSRWKHQHILSEVNVPATREAAYVRY